MVSMPFRDSETTSEFPSIEQKYAYSDVYSGYAYSQATLSKSYLHTPPIHFEPLADNSYPNWTGIAIDGCYLADCQTIQEQYTSIQPFESISTMYMTGYHAMEYEFHSGFPNQPQILTGFASGAFSSPYGACSDVPSYPQTAWSPSEPSVASLSPPYDVQWEGKDSLSTTEYPLGDGADEVLQGLGLYDCPELATELNFRGDSYESFPSMGRGLKLEESFEFKEEYSDDEEDDELYDDEDDEDEGEE